MFRSIFTILVLFSFSHSVFSLDDAISQRTYEYLKRVNEAIDEENWERAKKDLKRDYAKEDLPGRGEEA